MFTQTTGQDLCRVVLGEWVKADNYVWNFERALGESNNFVRLRETMTYKDLVAKVKEKLGLRAHEAVIKMAYQYPSWMELDDDDSDEGDFRIVPFSQQPNPTQLECSQARVRISDVESREAVGSHATTHETANTKADRSGDVEVNSCSIWGRVEEALQSILTDMSDDPLLFCRDAPPVFNDGKGGGNL